MTVGARTIQELGESADVRKFCRPVSDGTADSKGSQRLSALSEFILSKAPYVGIHGWIAQFAFQLQNLAAQENQRGFVDNWIVLDCLENGGPHELDLVLVGEQYSQPSRLSAAVAERQQSPAFRGQPCAAARAIRGKLRHFGKQRLCRQRERHGSPGRKWSDVAARFPAVGAFRMFAHSYGAGGGASLTFAIGRVDVNIVPVPRVGKRQQQCVLVLVGLCDERAVSFPARHQPLSAIFAAVERQRGAFAAFTGVLITRRDHSKRSQFLTAWAVAVFVQAYRQPVRRPCQHVQAVRNERVRIGGQPGGGRKSKQDGRRAGRTLGRGSEQFAPEFVEAHVFLVPEGRVEFVN